MWREYVRGEVRANRASSLSIAAAALIAALLLALLSALFYGIWFDEVARTVREEGGWHARIEAELTPEQLARVAGDGAVLRAGVGADGVEIEFRHLRRAYRELPRIAGALNVGGEALVYHEALLALYLVNDPNDPQPPLLVSFYLAVLALAALSLALVIRCAFAAAMEGKVRRLGVLASVGATPRQLRACLLWEAAALCAAPLAAGVALGTGLGILLMRVLAGMAEEFGVREIAFDCPPWVPLAALGLAAATVLASAWLPARRLSRTSPIQAVRGAEELRPKRRGSHRLLARLFGAEGLLAGASLRARRRSLRAATLSLMLAALGLALMLSFFALSGMSTEETYFMRYQDAWDVMLTLKGAQLAAVEPPEVDGARDAALYQWAQARTPVDGARMSAELRELGIVAAGSVPAPVMILDDASFQRFTGQARLDGAAVLNRCWDSAHSDFRHRAYVPFVAESGATELNGVEVSVIAYVDAGPRLREEYEDGALVHFVPLSLWRRIGGAVGGAEPEVYVRLLAREGAELEELDEMEAAAAEFYGEKYEVESENRLRERIENDAMIRGYELFLGGLCALLALIGLANAFANALSGARQRRREFARYRSIGVTPGGLKKMLCIEALIISARPLLLALLPGAAAVLFMLRASRVTLAEFLAVAPLLPLIVYALAVFMLVGLAHALAWRALTRGDSTEALRREFA